MNLARFGLTRNDDFEVVPDGSIEYVIEADASLELLASTISPLSFAQFYAPGVISMEKAKGTSSTTDPKDAGHQLSHQPSEVSLRLPLER